MRNAKVMKSLLCALTALIITFSLSLTCFAHDEIHHDEEVISSEEVTQEEPSTQAPTEAPTEAVTQAPTEAQTQAPTEEEEETLKPSDYDVHKDELPQVESQDIIVPTVAQLPDVEVSDTSLLGGVIAWLCVALGVAVIAGVLVSQRARQGGSSRTDTRRK